MDIHFENSANSKYQYSLYVHPKEAGIVFTMPKRVVALEGKFDIPPGKGKYGQIKGEVAFYMNKNAEPDKKTVLSFVNDNQVTDQSGHNTMLIKFNNPSLNKELMVKYESKFDLPGKLIEVNIDLDVFGKKQQKISINGFSKATKLENGYKVLSEINAVSKGLNLDAKVTELISLQMKDVHYDYKLLYNFDKTKSETHFVARANAQEAELLVKLMNKELLHTESKLQLSKESQTVDSTHSAYGLKPITTHFQLKNFNTMIYTLAQKENPNVKLHVSTGFIFGQIADFRAEILKGDAKNELIHATLKLDDANFMKPDFGINADNIQKMVLVSINPYI